MLASNPVTLNLIKARELIADEKNWCTDKVEDAGRYCAWGAVMKARDGWMSCKSGPEMEMLSEAAREQLARRYSIGSAAIILNNTCGHAAVMRMFDRAIELSLSTQGEAS